MPPGPPLEGSSLRRSLVPPPPLFKGLLRRCHHDCDNDGDGGIDDDDDGDGDDNGDGDGG